MAYGAYMLMENGQPFYTPQSTPIRLIGKYTQRSTIANAKARASIEIPVDLTKPYVPVVVAMSDKNHPVVFSTGIQTANQKISVSGFSYQGNNTSNFTMEVYMFQNTPRAAASGYGMALYDESGKLFLTHEDRVLTDLESVGIRGSNNAGLYAKVTKNGKWGVVPAFAGWYIFQLGGGPGVVPISAGFGGFYNGSQTILAAHPLESPAGAGGGGGSTGVPMTIVNLANYD